MGVRSRRGRKHLCVPSRGRRKPENGAAGMSAEDIVFCDVAIRLCPQVNYAELWEQILHDAGIRQERIRQLKLRARQGSYRVSAVAVAHALLRELDPGWQS